MGEFDQPSFTVKDLEAPPSTARTWALIGHLSIFTALPVIAPGLLYWFLAQQKASLFARFHALQAAVFQLMAVCAGFLLGLLWFVLPCFALLLKPFVMLFVLIAPVWGIYAGWRALRGHWYELPLAGGFARNKLGVPSMLASLTGGDDDSKKSTPIAPA